MAGPDTQIIPEYRAWLAMKSRCYCSRNISYRRYGARGITVHPSWVNDFSKFLRDVGERPGPGYSLDRYPDNNGNYEPGNVRWATKKEQQRNMRSNVILTLNGETRTMAEWTELRGWKSHAITWRLRHGWSVERALSEPMKYGR